MIVDCLVTLPNNNILEARGLLVYGCKACLGKQKWILLSTWTNYIQESEVVMIQWTTAILIKKHDWLWLFPETPPGKLSNTPPAQGGGRNLRLTMSNNKLDGRPFLPGVLKFVHCVRRPSSVMHCIAPRNRSVLRFTKGVRIPNPMTCIFPSPQLASTPKVKRKRKHTTVTKFELLVFVS